MKYLRILALALAALLLLGALPVFAARAEGEAPLPYWIGVDVVNQRVTVYSTADNSVVHRWLISSGTSSTPTPTGTYTLPSSSRKEWNKFGSVYVKWAVRIKGGYFFHSVLFSRRDDNSLQTSTLHKLGHPASHGCIRMEVSNAKWICDNCAPGTKVIIHKGVNDARITSALGGSAGVAVTPSMPAAPTVQALTLDPAGPITLNRGETLQLSCAVTPDGVSTSLSWRSSKKKCVTVSSTGLVTAVREGFATVTVTASNGVKASVRIDCVDNTAARSVALDRKGVVYVNVGETLQLNATVDPDTAAAGLTWKSSKPRYAAVDGSGLVTGVAKGTSRITVQTSNRKRAAVTVKVLDPWAPAKVQLAEKGPWVLHIGETLQLNPKLTPDTAKTTYTWTSGRTKVATVDDSGLVTAMAKGRAKITVRTANRKRATIIIRVVD